MTTRRWHKPARVQARKGRVLVQDDAYAKDLAERKLLTIEALLYMCGLEMRRRKANAEEG